MNDVTMQCSRLILIFHWIFLSAVFAADSDITSGKASAHWTHADVEQILPGVWKFHFGQTEKFTPVFFRESSPRAEGFKNLPVPPVPPLDFEKVRCRVTASRTTVYVPCDEPGEQIYGFGLDPGAYAQKGLDKNLTVCSTVIGKTGASHGPVPFYVSTKGYGIYVDTARVPVVHVARLTPVAEAGAGERQANLPKISESELYAAEVAHGKSEVIFELPGDSTGVDVYLFGGPTLREAVQRYNLFGGGGAVPPLWGLGLKYRTFTRADQDNVLRSAKALRDLKIPCDMIGLEPGWQSQSYSCSFTWSPERFPEHEKMIRELQRSGFKVNLWEHAYVHPRSPMFAALKAHAGDFLVWGGLVLDFPDADASRIFSDFHDRELVSEGVMGFKGDECDRQPFSDATPFNFPYSSIFSSGIDGDQLSQLYGYLYQRALYEPFKRHNLRTWGDVRATSALASPLPFNLYSDAYTFDEYLRQLANASFTGLLWSPEVRQAGTLGELLNRTALSAFASQMCLDMWFMPNPVWEQYNREKNEKHDFLPEAEQKFVADRLRAIINRRYSFLPYLYSSFQKYHTEGLPPVRSLLLDFPGDSKLREVDDEFMFGESLLVAPFLGDATNRSVILPRDVNWCELKTGEWHPGGSVVSANGVAGEIPLFVKENTLLPIAEPVPCVATNTVFKITVKVFGKTPKPFTLFEDDGITFDFEKGNMNRLVLRWNGVEKGSVERTGSFPMRRYEIVSWESAAATE